MQTGMSYKDTQINIVHSTTWQIPELTYNAIHKGF